MKFYKLYQLRHVTKPAVDLDITFGLVEFQNTREDPSKRHIHVMLLIISEESSVEP